MPGNPYFENIPFIPSLIILGLILNKKINKNPPILVWYIAFTIAVIQLSHHLLRLFETHYILSSLFTFTIYVLICFKYVKASLVSAASIENKKIYINTNLIVFCSFFTLLLIHSITQDFEYAFQTFIWQIKSSFLIILVYLLIVNIATYFALKKYQNI